VALGGSLVEGDDADLGEQDPEIGAGASCLPALGDAEPKLGQRDVAHAQLRGPSPDQMPPDALVSIENRDADIRIDEDLHNGRRRSALV
jgi:hypothetical protein